MLSLWLVYACTHERNTVEFTLLLRTNSKKLNINYYNFGINWKYIIFESIYKAF